MASWEDISCGLLELETDSVLWVVSTASPLTGYPAGPGLLELSASLGEGTGRHDSL